MTPREQDLRLRFWRALRTCAELGPTRGGVRMLRATHYWLHRIYKIDPNHWEEYREAYSEVAATVLGY